MSHTIIHIKSTGTRRLVAVLTSLLVWAAVLTAGASAATDGPNVHTPTAVERVAAYDQPSITYLEVTFSSRIKDTFYHRYIREEPFSVTYNCSGFFVNPNGYVATAGHCVSWDDGVREDLIATAAEWAYENDYYLYDKGETPKQAAQWAVSDFRVRGERDRDVRVSWGVAASGIGQPRNLPARLVGSMPFERGDVALLKIDAEMVPTLLLDPDSDVVVGEPIVSVGFPASVDAVTDADKFDPSFEDGNVSSKKTIGGGLVDVYQLSAPLSGGMSGGPTVDMRGNVIGVNSFGIVGEPQPFNFVTPSALVKELLADKGVQNVLGQADRLYREGLAAYWKGDKEEALARLDEAIQVSQSFASAQEYRAKAALLPDPPKESLPLLPIVAGAAGALLALAGSAWLVLSRGRRISTRREVEGLAVSEDATGGMAGRPLATEHAGVVGRTGAGQPSALAATAARFCIRCGAQFAPSGRFCGSCGHSVA